MLKILLPEKCGLHRKIIDRKKTQFIKIRNKVAAPYSVGMTFLLAQSYSDIPKELLPNNINNRHWGFYNKKYVRNELLQYRIKILSCRAMKLHDITDEDIMKEGVEKVGNIFVNGITGKTYKSARRAFSSLVNEIHGKYTWRLNPHIFVYDFELVN